MCSIHTTTSPSVINGTYEPLKGTKVSAKIYSIDATGKLVSENFYWLSTKADVLDWAKRSDTVYTPQKEFGDLSGLNTLPTVKVAITKRLDFAGKIPLLTVIAENKSNSVAFMVHPR